MMTPLSTGSGKAWFDSRPFEVIQPKAAQAQRKKLLTEINFEQLAAFVATPPVLVDPDGVVHKATEPIVDPDPDGFVCKPDNGAPNFNTPWADLPLSRAIKAQLNDPDSYKFIDTTDPVADHVNGAACWTVVVHFLAKNLFNATTRNYAYVSVVSNGKGSWQVIDCRLNP